MINAITGLPNRVSHLREDVIIDGSLTINNGGQTAGFVLVSDANGLATWQSVTGITPTDNTISGGTYTILSGGTIIFTNTTGGSFSVTGLTPTNIIVTGGTYSNGISTFTNNTGGTFTVTGFFTGATDVFVNSGTFSGQTLTLTNTSGGSFTVTGFTSGSSGGTGLAAYGYAVGQSSTTIDADGDVIFDLGGTPFPNAGMTVPSPGGSAFTITSTGDYEFNFYVASTTHAAFATTPLVFAIYRNGAIATVAGNAYEFRGTFDTSDANQSVTGQGIIALTAGDVITLHNRTNTVTDSVTVAATQTGVEASPNRTLSLKKLN